LAIAKAHGREVTSLAFAADSTTLISAGFHFAESKGPNQPSPRIGQIRFWNTTTGERLREMAPGDNEDGSCTWAMSTDRRLIAAAFNRKIRIWEAGTGNAIRTLSDYRNNHGHRSQELAFSPDGTKLAARSGDGAVRVWDVGTGKRLLHFPDAHTDCVDSVAYSPDGRLILSGSREGSVRMWDAGSCKQIHKYLTAGGPVRVAFSPDGKTVGAGGSEYVN